ncbi:MAG: 2-hydroxychromene-2-carboxylate isomerase [Pseudomonadota bacterium]
MDFWFDFASTYSYLSAMRIERLAQERGVKVAWRPFLLGPIFNAQGWPTSPFKLYPAKGLHMWRDMEHQAEKYGIAFHRPPEGDHAAFPRNSLLAARIALVGLDEAWGRPFCKAVYTAEFVDGADIGQGEVLLPLAQAAGAPADVLERAAAQDIKDRLRAQTEKAAELGLFGAPSFTVATELFWGDDRLEDALAFAASRDA